MTKSLSPPAKASERVQALSVELEAHNHRYYVLDEPSIPDAAYDRLLRELQDLEKQYPSLLKTTSPTQRVGAEPVSAFGEIVHLFAYALVG